MGLLLLGRGGRTQQCFSGVTTLAMRGEIRLLGKLSRSTDKNSQTSAGYLQEKCRFDLNGRQS